MSPHGYIFQSAENNLFVRRLRDFFEDPKGQTSLIISQAQQSTIKEPAVKRCCSGAYAWGEPCPEWAGLKSLYCAWTSFVWALVERRWDSEIFSPPQNNRNTCSVRFCSEVDIPKKTGIQQKIPYLPTGALAFTRSFVPNFGILDSERRLGRFNSGRPCHNVL